MTTSDTPRTDEQIWTAFHHHEKMCDVVDKDFARQLERELAASLENQCRAQAEVAKLNHQLLKTESELLQSQDINLFLDTEFKIACKRAKKAEKELTKIKEAINPTDK
jgi:hypothetical protein